MSQRQRHPQPDALSFRTFAVRAESVDEKERSVEAVITTEAAVPMWDWERHEVVPEILLMKGAEYPRQVPFLNAHARYDIDHQLGSARQIRVDGEQLLGRMFFASSSQAAFEKVREGHVTDVSAGYQRFAVIHVPRGQKQTVAGREYTGPVNVVTKWKLREVSLVPIGADEQAKLRGLSIPPFPKKEFAMNEQLRALCVARGMDASLSDEDAQKWMVEHFAQPEGNRGAIDIQAITEAATKAASEAARALMKEEQQKIEAFRKEVDAACELAELPGERQASYGLADIVAVRSHLLEVKKKEADQSDVGYGAPIRMVEAQRDKHVAAIGTALTLRSLSSTNCKQARVDSLVPPDKRGAGWEQFRNASLIDLARECLHADGIATRGLSREHIAIAALGWPEKVGIRAAPAYHTTGSFSKLTADAVNKSMMVGYQEFPSTWRRCFRQADSGPDLRMIHRIRMGAIPNLPDWVTNLPPEEASFKDAEETYRVQPKSLKISFSWDLLVNDDMSMLGRVPQMFGDAAARTVNALAWAQITSNPTMEDGVVLFSAASGNRKRSNLTSGAGAPSTSTVQTLRNLMRQMRGENTPENNESQDILNLEPAYIVGPSALEQDVISLVRSAYDPASNVFQKFNTASVLEPIIEPILDANSLTAWYLFASTSRIDTVEVTFLQGHESPVTRSWMDEATLAQNWAVLQAVAAKAMNHRGVQKHAGA